MLLFPPIERTLDLTNIISIILLVFSYSSFAQKATYIEWSDLKLENNEEPVILPDLSQEQLIQIQEVFTLTHSDTKESKARIEVISKTLQKEGVNAEEVLKLRDQYIAQKKREAELTTTQYDGQNVRMSGFIVPLNTSQEMVVNEFLLVPTAGACIHMPPPPANQVIRVSYPKGFAMRTIQYPVWIEGTIKSGLQSENLFIIDGRRDVTMGYSLEAVNVVDYDW